MRRETWIYVGFAAIILVLVASFLYNGGSLWGPCGGRPGMGHMHRGFFGVGFYGFGILFWVLVIFFIVLVVSSTRREDSMEILNRRFARGEISQEEYAKMKEELKK